MAGDLSRGDLPVLDLNAADTSSEDNLRRVGSQLHEAFSKAGLAFLVNHGISEDTIQAVNEAMDKFCSLPEDMRKQYVRLPSENHGYVPPGLERLENKKVSEARETFNVQWLDRKLPDQQVPGFKSAVSRLVEDLRRLTHHLLKCVALGLGLEEGHFTRLHSQLLEDGNATTLRMLYYPPLAKDVPTNVTRCGEHTDYGTFTLIMQDCEGGLEIKSPDNKWIRVGHMPGTILLNTADLLATWTCGKYPAVRHRVVVPEQEQVRSKGRHSIAFFVHPDDDVPIIPISGSQHQVTFTAKEHLERRLKETYNY